MAKVLPIILIVFGIGAGGGVGYLLKPKLEDCQEPPCEEIEPETEAEDSETEPNFLAMKNQFVIPIIKDDLVRSLVVLSISLEIGPDSTSFVFSREPKLRDKFLRVLFDHSHIGGFDGAFTESGRLSILRIALLEAAQTVIGDVVSDILITDIVRQEM